MVEFTVTVPFGTGGGYYIDGVQKPIVPVVTGGTFRFNQNAASNNGHPLILSTTTSTAGIISTGVSYYLDGGGESTTTRGSPSTYSSLLLLPVCSTPKDSLAC